MSDEILLICSTADPASLNIAKRLMELESWKEVGEYWSFGRYRLIIHNEEQIKLYGLEKRISDLGLKPELVVFPCRHKSKEGVPWLGGHFTGEVSKGWLSEAAPVYLRSFLHNIRRSAPIGFRTSAEATHHGPTDLTIPSFFAEIGSSESQWSDLQAGLAVASSILCIERLDLPVLLGFGGGHYVQRQTELMFEAEIAFGHLFSSYQMEFVNPALIEKAKQKSGARYAYLDRKSLDSKGRSSLTGMLEELDIPLLKGKEIRARFPIVVK